MSNNRAISQDRLANSLIGVVLQWSHVWFLGSRAVVGDGVVGEEMSPFFHHVDGRDAVGDGLDFDVVFGVGLEEFVGCWDAEP